MPHNRKFIKGKTHMVNICMLVALKLWKKKGGTIIMPCGTLVLEERVSVAQSLCLYNSDVFKERVSVV